MKHRILKALALVCALFLLALPAIAEGLNICIISSTGVDDGSFNQDCYIGIQDFIASHDDCKVTDIKEPDYAQLVPTVEKLVGDYDVFVLPGFNFAAIGDIVLSNPDKFFLVVDSTIQDGDGNPVFAPGMAGAHYAGVRDFLAALPKCTPAAPPPMPEKKPPSCSLKVMV